MFIGMLSDSFEAELRTPASPTAPGREGDYSGLANVRCSIMVGIGLYIYVSQGSGQSRQACICRLKRRGFLSAETPDVATLVSEA